ncbi:MAG: D-amino acid aminotransferase [Thiothrix sp.]|nr:MAG: D-amino acid aminotransferase [Thiothrix sp.]
MTIFLNGEWMPAQDAQISVFDRGFLFADGVYEVIPVYRGKPFHLQQHFTRLSRSLAAIDLDNPLEENKWFDAIEKLIAENGAGNMSIYLQISRGVSSVPRDHQFPEVFTPTFFMASHPIKPLTDNPDKAAIKAILKDDIRWGRCDIKSVSMLGNAMLRQSAVSSGAQEALLMRNGHMTEGAASNLFIVQNGEIMTPPEGPEILSGITRATVLSLAKEFGIQTHEAPLPANTITQADEVWISSSTKGIAPIIQIDDIPIGNGAPGPVWKKMQHAYMALVTQMTSHDE